MEKTRKAEKEKKRTNDADNNTVVASTGSNHFRALVIVLPCYGALEIVGVIIIIITDT